MILPELAWMEEEDGGHVAPVRIAGGRTIHIREQRAFELLECVEPTTGEKVEITMLAVARGKYPDMSTHEGLVAALNIAFQASEARA